MTDHNKDTLRDLCEFCTRNFHGQCVAHVGGKCECDHTEAYPLRRIPAKPTEATLDLQAIRARADRMERDHECPGDPKRAKWCAKEPCGTMQTVAQLRGMADEIERLRFLTSDLEACTDILTGQSDKLPSDDNEGVSPELERFRQKMFAAASGGYCAFCERPFTTMQSKDEVCDHPEHGVNCPHHPESNTECGCPACRTKQAKGGDV